MQPNQPSAPAPHPPSGPGPQPPYHPPEYTIDPNAGGYQPAYGAQQPIHRHENGQYEVVPPPQPTANNGQSGHNAYEFIVASGPTKKPGLLSSLGSAGTAKSFWLKIGLFAGGAAVLLIIAGILISALGPKGSVPGMIAIAQRQQEIVRIASAATGKAATQDTKNFAANVGISVGSSQGQILKFLSARGHKIGRTDLALDHDAKTDSLLLAAASANSYDSAAVSNLTEQLQTYETLVRSTYKQTNNKVSKALLQTCFDSADALLKQAQALPGSNTVVD